MKWYYIARLIIEVIGIMKTKDKGVGLSSNEAYAVFSKAKDIHEQDDMKQPAWDVKSLLSEASEVVE